MARKPSRIRRTFTPQFKKDAVALVLGGRTVNEVAHDLGIARSLLQRWKTQLAREPNVPAAFPGAGRLAPQAEQLRQLQQPHELHPELRLHGAERETRSVA